jgi:hypothetical protein
MSTSPRPATNGHSRRGRLNGHDSARLTAVFTSIDEARAA